MERVMKVAGDAARTGKIGDGKIMVTDTVDAMRIRTGETGETAIEVNETAREDKEETRRWRTGERE
jgi:hypothetical protein